METPFPYILPDPTKGIAPELFLLGGIAILFFLGLGFFAVMLLRKRAEERLRLGEGERAPVTLQIMLPKFQSEEEGKSREAQQTTKEKIAVAETLFAALGGISHDKSFSAWITGYQDVLALEIVALEKIIAFYATVPRKYQEFFEQQVHAQWSSASIEEVDDFNIFSPKGVAVGGYITQRRDVILPVKTYKDLETDPLNALTNALSQVAQGDGVLVQFLLRPAANGWRERGQRIVRNMHEGMTFAQAKKGGKVQRGWWEKKEDFEKREVKMKERKLTALETKMLEGIEQKISKAGLEVNIRVVACAAQADAAQLYVKNALNAFGQFSIYEYGNAFQGSIPSSKKELIKRAVYRQFSAKHKMMLNTEELASLWHLPLHTTETPNIKWLLAKVAPPPVNTPQEGLLMGFNLYRGKHTEIFMKDADRRRHTYIIGKTGAGKSEFIKNLIAQDIKYGRGVAVIDPHGDLADGVLELIPKERVDDVVYFNPSDMDRPMGLNMLEVPISEEELNSMSEDEKRKVLSNMRDFAVQEMINIFYMLFPPEMIGPMFEHNMRNYMLTLMADPKNPGTIVEIPRMIADEAFQKEWVSRVTDPVVRSFWEDEMAKTSDYHKSEMMGYLVSKVGRFVENEMMRNIIGQTHSAFDFRKIMDEKKILLVNLSKGKTGEVNASLLGLILVAKLQMAAFRRADMEESKRTDFYLYIDEFQNFITPSIATILSEARKYRLNLIMAHQYMGQLVKDGKTEIRDAVLGNVGSMLVARVGPEDVEVLGKVFEPTFSASDLMNTDKFTWNVKMIIDNAQERPFTMKAYPPVTGSPRVAELLKDISRLQYGRAREEVEEEILERAGLNKSRKKEIMPPPPVL